MHKKESFMSKDKELELHSLTKASAEPIIERFTPEPILPSNPLQALLAACQDDLRLHLSKMSGVSLESCKKIDTKPNLEPKLRVSQRIQEIKSSKKRRRISNT